MLSFIEDFILGERAVRNGARVIAVVWSFSWIVFGFISGIGEGLRLGGVVTHTLLPGFVFLLSILITFWHEGVGGITIFIEGLVITVYFATQLGSIAAVGAYFVLFYGSLPALIVGSLFIYSWRTAKVNQASKKVEITAQSQI